MQIKYANRCPSPEIAKCAAVHEVPSSAIYEFSHLYIWTHTCLSEQHTRVNGNIYSPHHILRETYVAEGILRKLKHHSFLTHYASYGRSALHIHFFTLRGHTGNMKITFIKRIMNLNSFLSIKKNAKE